MRIGVAQMNLVPGAFDRTVERMLAQAQRAEEQGADLVVFPLPALAGIALPSYADRPAFLADVADAVSQLAAQLPCPAVVAVPIDSDETECSFDALLLDQGGVRPLYMEAYLKDMDGEGPEIAEFELAGNRIALALSYDDIDSLVSAHRHEFDTLIYLSGNPFALDDPSSAMGSNLEGARYIDDARAAGAWIVGVGPIGGYGEEVFCGSSFVLDPEGNLMAALPAFEEDLRVIEVGHSSDRDVATNARHGLTPEVFDAPFAAWQAVCLGIHDFVWKQGATDAALVLDGSLASQVLLALASDALGPLHVHALIGASAGSGAPACRDLGHRLHVHQVDGATRPGLSAFEARGLDEVSLASLAADFDAVALSSLDKTALALGLSSRQVSCATFLPLGDIYRTDVLDMAHVRNTISPLFRRVELGEADAVTLSLADGMARTITGEQDLTRVDEVLLGFVEYDRPLHDLVGDGRADDELIDAVLRAVRRGEAARRALGPALVMSTHTLDEARFPLAMRWDDEHPDGLGGFGQDLFPDVPEPSDVTAREAPSRPPRGRGPFATPRAGDNDIAGTLAMIRDLIEQGGFGPVELGKVPQPGTDGDGAGASGGWGSIFSEN